MNDHSYSYSLRKNAQLGKLVDVVPMLSIIPKSDSATELPQLFDVDGSKIELDISNELTEKEVQNMINQAFCRNKIGAGFYLNDTHNKETFLGYDLLPDFMASSDDCVPLTEPSVCFILKVKAGKEKPWDQTHLGQAAAYGTRLLEKSSDIFRPKTIVVVTNLNDAAIVQVSRTHTQFEYKYARTKASEALRNVFHASRRDLGINVSNLYPVGDKVYNISNYLGSGATSCVYSTKCGHVAKFYLRDSTSLNHERDNLELLNNSLTQCGESFNFSFQNVVDSNESNTSFPFLILSPVGSNIHSQNSVYFNRSSVLKILKSIEFAHTKCNLLHLDIRPDNFICLPNGDWMLIDWAAARRCDSVGDCQYAGCVTTAADSVLIKLSQCQDSEDSLPIISVSRVTDCISLLRTVFLLTNRISPVESSKLTKCRNENDFNGIILWWASHLPPMYTDFEVKLNKIFEEQSGNIYYKMMCFIQTNISSVL